MSSEGDRYSMMSRNKSFGSPVIFMFVLKDDRIILSRWWHGWLEAGRIRLNNLTYSEGVIGCLGYSIGINRVSPKRTQKPLL
jgi:hypothetical protein